MLSETDLVDIRKIRHSLLALRAEMRALSGQHWRRKFDPAQPRDEIGRWTDAGNGIAGMASEEGAYRDVIPVGAKQPAAYCWNQMQIDMMLCSSLRPAPLNAACRAQAMERYAACMSGRPIPPLPF